ncbi:MAG: MurR/RpiR family transcriptional regulator [Solirubrobacterales bacterium]
MTRAATQPETTTDEPTGAARPGYSTLSAYITERFDGFSRSQKDVARYIVDHLDEAAFQTAEELARRADTSSSTVVRFSQALGFEGYPELQQAAIEEYRRGVGEGQRPLFSLDPTEVEASLAADYADLEETARKLDGDAVHEAVEALASAQRIVVVGVDQMAFFASYLRHLLALLDLRAEIIASASQEALSKLGRVSEGTVVVGLAAGRAHGLVLRAVKLASRRGARTITVCDSTLSEAAKVADISLYYSSNGPSFTRSHAALLSLVQALAYGVYAHEEGAKDRIRAFSLK